jgi:hypothetical protein
MTRATRPEPTRSEPTRSQPTRSQQVTAPADALAEAVADEQHRMAAVARSILSCPADVDLVVDGVPTPLEHDDVLGLQDVHGSPTFSCRPGSELALAGVSGRSALLTLASGLGPVGSSGRADSLVLAGRLETRGREDCECCTETRDIVGLQLNFALLTSGGGVEEPEQQFRVPLEHFRSGVHHLNRGFLQRSVEHANDCHQDELRRAVSLSSGTRMTDVVGVRLTGLSTRGVVVGWVDTEGAHRTVIDFPRPARSPAELGDLLRRELNAGLC